MITDERLEEIFEDGTPSDLMRDSTDNTLEGLNILAKYVPYVCCGADHDILYGPDIEKVVEAGLTEEDAITLSRLNWMIKDEYFACFV